MSHIRITARGHDFFRNKKIGKKSDMTGSDPDAE